MDRPAARLEVVAGNAFGTSLLVEDELVIGRLAEGPGRLAGDDEISRSHARLTLDRNGVCTIEDRGSTNGTFVNGQRISTPHVLSEGDRIELGGTTLIVREIPRPTSPETVEHRGEPTVVPSAQAAGEPGESRLSDVPVLSVVEGASKPEAGVGSVALSVHLDIDFAAGEARISIDAASDPVRLVFDSGRWRVSSTANTEGEPHE